jgi:hypothetical protein
MSGISISNIQSKKNKNQKKNNMVPQIILNWLLIFGTGFGISYLIQAFTYRTLNIKEFPWVDNYMTLLTVWGFISIILGIIFAYV